MPWGSITILSILIILYLIYTYIFDIVVNGSIMKRSRDENKKLRDIIIDNQDLKDKLEKFKEERDRIKAIILGEQIEPDMALYRNGNYSIYATEEGDDWYTLKKYGKEICTYKWEYERVKKECDQYAKDDPS